MQDEVELTADVPIAELGRQMMAAQLAIIHDYDAALRQNADVTAVHETRKAIRRTFTAVRIFHPYFAPGALEGYRRQLKKLMKRLGRCRDTAVFLGKLDVYINDSAAPLTELTRYWQDQKTVADANLHLYIERPKWPPFWEGYAKFIATPGAGVLPSKIGVPVQARHLIPVLLYQRVAAVRAYDDYLAAMTELSVKKLHQLRIECKELRYAFQFFTPLLGPEIEPAISVLKALQVNLGDLNDARVALEMLADTPGRETAVACYREAQIAETNRLLNDFHPLWAKLNAPVWRENLAMALAML
ncbi:MAG: CHAD domain-containing protein [Chloroflexi bacterium]|nr:CHAD domain-containing protein [Chloroflexota bacterium]